MNERLKSLRLHLGYTQEEMAVKTGISLRSLQNYEGKKREIPSKVLLSLNAHLGVNPLWFLTGEGPMFLENKEKKETSPDLVGKINALLEGMDEDRKREVLRYTEEKKLLDELIREKRKCCL